MPSSTFNKYRLKGAYHHLWYETELWYKTLVDRAVDFCQGSTLDVGGGEGLLAGKIMENDNYSTVLESDQYAIDLIPLNQSWIKCDVDNKSEIKELLAEESWEYMACLNTIEHLNNPKNLLYIIDNFITKGAIISTIDYQGGALGEDHKFEWTYDEMMDFFKEFNPKGFRYKDTEWIGVEIRK